MRKITHQEIDELSSLQSHPGWKTYVSLVKDKVEHLTKMIDTLETMKIEKTYNNTEATILRKAYLNEVVNLPVEITESYRIDQDIAKANKQAQDFIDHLDDEKS